MGQYRNRGGNSGILEYEVGSDYIKVKFSNRWAYTYNYTKVGSANIEIMKQLAQDGKGLNTFISRIVKKRFAKKERW